MSRSFIHLRRAMFGVSCTVVFGFGATQAFATDPEPVPTVRELCIAGTQEGHEYCETWCWATYNRSGFCHHYWGYCDCNWS